LSQTGSTMDTAENKTDSQLLADYINGSEEAFREIVGRYKDPLYAFLRRLLNQPNIVDEVFQETFLQLYQSRETFDMERPLRPWLFTIAANKARDALRRQQRAGTTSIGTMGDTEELSIEDVVSTLKSYQITPYEDAARAETAARVRQVIEKMPANLKEILLLAYFEQFSYKQMAAILSIPIGTVKSRLHTAIVHFTKKWKAMNGGNNL